QGYMTDLLNERALKFVQSRHDKPFLLYLAHKAPHGPFTPAERHMTAYTKEQIPHPPNTQDTFEGKPMLQRKVGDLPPLQPGAAVHENLIRNQLRQLLSIDEGVGKILRALEEKKQLDNTLVIYTSDNGYLWGEHGLGDKRPAYEESIRVPLVMRYPKLI